MSNIRATLFDGSDNERTKLIHQLVKDHRTDVVDTLIEILLSDSSAAIRGLCFFAICSLAEKEAFNPLLEALQEEEQEEVQQVMVQLLVQFAMLHGIQLDQDINTILPNQLRQAVKQAPKEKRATVPNQMQRSPEEAMVRLKQLLLDVEPNIPISLQRMSDLTGITSKSLDRYLRSIADAGLLSGKYYPLEQVFFKEQATIHQVLDTKPPPPKKCRECGEETTLYPCKACGGGVQCSTCKLAIGIEEDSIACPLCHQLSHRTHFLEWIKIKGTCPHCRQKIQLPIS